MKDWSLFVWRYTTERSLLVPVLALHLLTLLLVLPRGNFPLNDDWIYAKMVQTVLTEHHYVQHPFSQPVAVAQILWGALFCGIFGFNYVTLRCSTLVLGVIGAWVTAKCVTECGGSRKAALLAAFTVSANPIFMNLSYTFMTDVPYYTTMALSALFYLRALRSNRPADIALGGVFGLLAVLVRQLALSAGVAYVCAVVYMRLRHKTQITPRNIVAFFAPWCAAAMCLLLWKFSSGAEHAAQLRFDTRPLAERAQSVYLYAVMILTMVGLWVLPWTAARIPAMRSWLAAITRPRALLAAAFTSVLALTFMLLVQKTLPVPGNIFHKLGSGGFSITGAYLDGLSRSSLVTAAWFIATGMALVSAGAFLVDMTGLSATVRTKLTKASARSASRRQKASNAPNQVKDTAAADLEPLLPLPAQRIFLQALFLLTLGASLSPLIPIVFDRYALALLLAVILMGSGAFPEAMKNRIHPFALVAGAMLYCFSLAGVHDYLAWNEARWKALDYLQNDVKAPIKRIDGGFEFNGVYTSQEYMKEKHITDFWKCGHGFQWWLFDDTYAVAFSPRKGYKELKAFPYSSWMGWGEYRILALKRD